MDAGLNIMLLPFVFGLVCGAVGILFHLVSKEKSNPKGPVFYLNGILCNKSEIISKKVDEKIGYGLFGLRRKLVKKAAMMKVSDAQISSKIAKSLAANIPQKLKDKFGSAVVPIAKVCFVKGPLFVISVEIASVNIVQLLTEKKGGEKKVSILKKMFRLLSKFGLERVAEKAANEQAAQAIELQMTRIMGDQVMEKLEREGGVKTLITAVHEADQAASFFGLIEDLEKNA